ncbi:MAG: hypothetical protein O2780_04375 [Proteobacteria bacterium]|nr:hypothetical protein [Pseudomonadota bacterium]
MNSLPKAAGLRVLADVSDPDVIDKILTHLVRAPPGLPAQTTSKPAICTDASACLPDSSSLITAGNGRNRLRVA